MPTGRRLEAYLRNELAGEAEALLNAMARLPGAPTVMNDWNRHVIGFNTSWFYEGTLRAVVYACVEEWLSVNAHPGEEEWILLAEQAYPVLTMAHLRADVALRNEANEWAFIEIKADFLATSPDGDVGKLVEACNELDGYLTGLLLFAVWDEAATIADWRARLEQQLGNGRVGYARPLIRE